MKCGPDECPIVAFSDLTPAEQRVKRKRIAEKMTAEGFTQAQIAKVLGVSRQTVPLDLEGLPIVGKPQRPKGGRPKSSEPKAKRTGPKPERHKHSPVVEQIAANLVLDEGKTREQAAAEAGVSEKIVQFSVAKELGRREAKAEPDVDRADLSMTAQQKFDAAINREKQRMAMSFEQRVRDEIKKRVDEMILPEWKRQIKEAQNLYDKRRGLMPKDTFNTIRRALHPDSRNSISDKKLSEAFDAFMSLEKYLLNEKDSPTKFGDLPDTLAEWDKMRVKRPAKRSKELAIRPR